MRLRRVALFLVICAASLAMPRPALALLGVEDASTFDVYSTINIAVGAGRFYDNGYWGQGVLVANVEAGLVWNGHEATSNGSTYYVPADDPGIRLLPPQYDWHATAVGFTLTGLGPYDPKAGGYYYYQMGIAPGAALASVGIATGWNLDPNAGGQFYTSTQSTVSGYKTVMATGVPIPWGGPNSGITVTVRADVVNSSWGLEDPAGTAFETKLIDALAYANHQTVCLAAGNHQSGEPTKVVGPAAGYNAIAVGALGGVGTGYTTLAAFSNVGPNDYYNPTASGRPSASGVRPAVDIVAPGTDLFLAAYTGTTGSNTGTTDPAPGATDLYWVGAAGTSFASPIVAGGATLLVGAGYSNFGGGAAVDGRVIKAVLLNSARKLDGWTNHTVFDATRGALTTTQGLDYAQGAGALDLNAAYDQYLAAGGTHDVPGLGGGAVAAIGWDYGQVSKDNPNVYFIGTSARAGQQAAVTLDWFVKRTYDDATQTAADGAFDVLNLAVWQTDGEGHLLRLVAESNCPYNTVQHLYFDLPADGYYALAVNWDSQNYDVAGNTPLVDEYGLAWNVPEPASLSLLALGGLLLPRRRR